MELGPIFNQETSGQDLANDQGQKQATSSCFGEITANNSLLESDSLASTLEPMFRKVVSEVLDLKLKQHAIFTKPSLVLPQTQAALETPRFKLVISKNPSLPIFSGNKILDCDKKPLEIILVDANNYTGGDQMMPISLDPPPKVELVVLNGDFPPRGHDSWTSHQFHNNIVKERSGKPPLIIGNLPATLKDGVATFEDVQFTDNSSWIPSRTFKIGARVALGTNAFHGCILEAMTEPFVVKEHRMGLYKKHCPPMLDDEIWRLVKIRKNGVFHKKLAHVGISTVKDFLNLSATSTDEKKLRGLLGSKMSDKMWEAVLKHARTCKVDNNIPQEQSSVDRIQQGVLPENAMGAEMDQSCLSHVQANDHLITNVDGDGSMSFGIFSLDHILPSTSQLLVVDPDFKIDKYYA